MNDFSIYKITNIINGKKYIGQTIRNPKIRWYEHCGQESKSLIHKAIKKYGKENFKFEVIDYGNTIDELNEKEKYWIKYYNSLKEGYNLSEGGYNSIPTKETLIKQSLAEKELWNNPEFRSKMSELKKGKRNPNYNGNKGIKNPMYGKHHSDETKLMLSQKNKGKHFSVNTEFKSRKILCVEENMIYCSMADVSRKFNVSVGNLNKVCNGIGKTLKGFHFKYAD